ncbi:MAG: PAS domain S-box protein, partial [Methanolinea sp.]
MTPEPSPSPFRNFDILPAGIVVIRPDYTVIFWNRTISEWTGIPPGEILGRDIREVYPHLREKRYALRIGQVFEGGAAAFFSTQFHPHFIPARLHGGDLRYQRTTVHPVDTGGETCALLFIDDVTDLVSQVRAYREMRDRALREVREREEKEAALAESEAKFRQIFDSVNDAIHITELREDGLPGRFIEANAIASRMLGFERDELLATSPLDLVCGPHSRPFEEIGREILEKGETIFETCHRKKDGGEVPVEIHARRARLMGRDVIVAIVRDISQRKRDREALVSLSRDLRTIIDNVPAMIWYKDTQNRVIRANPAAALPDYGRFIPSQQQADRCREQEQSAVDQQNPAAGRFPGQGGDEHGIRHHRSQFHPAPIRV